MRDAIIIFVAIIAAMGIGAYLFFIDLPSSVETPAIFTGPENNFTVLHEGQDSGDVTRRTNFRIMNEQEFIELWTLIYGTGGPQRPYVDFARSEVIAVFDGTHSSGGYLVAVTGVEDAGGVRTIYILRQSPGEGCITTEAITSPFQLISVSRTKSPVARDEAVGVRDCGAGVPEPSLR